MSTQRRSITEGLPSLDEMANQFKPKTETKLAPPPEKVAEIAEKANFTSREPAQSTRNARPRREPMYYRTGRTAQFTCKTAPEILDDFYAFARHKGWKVNETFERAFQALLEKESGN